MTMEWILGSILIALMMVIIILLIFVFRKKQSTGDALLLEDRTRALEQEKNRADSLQRDLTAANAETSTQKTLVAEREQRIHRLEDGFKQSIATCDALKVEIAKANAAISGHEATIALQAKQLSELEAKWKAAADSCDVLKPTLAKSEANLSACKTQLEAQQQEMTSLGTKLKDVTASCDALRPALAKAEATATTVTSQALTQRERIEKLEKELKESIASCDSLKAENAAAGAAASSHTTLITNQKQRIQELETGLAEAMAARDDLTAVNAKAGAAISSRDAQIVALQKQLAEDRAAQALELQKLHEKFNTEFQNIANKIFEDKTAKFAELNGESLKNILGPLGLSLKEFKETVGHYNELSMKERTELGTQVKDLVELNKTLGTEAKNLTHALTTESQKQGRWGEIILERLLEESGLLKDINYSTQCQLMGEDGKPLKSMADEKMRPDAVVRLPDNKFVIIDAKCSLTAFVRATDAAGTDESRAEALEDHLGSVRKHIDELSTKAYDDYRKSLNFVLMFIPSEAAYGAAMQGDADLWQYAYGKRILIVSPMTLLISLRLIADLWKRENQARHVQEIAERGAKLYDKFIGFAEVFAVMDKKITDLRSSYDDANKKLTTGIGNLVWQAEKLKALGISTKKAVPAALLKDASLGDVVEEASASLPTPSESEEKGQ